MRRAWEGDDEKIPVDEISNYQAPPGGWTEKGDIESRHVCFSPLRSRCQISAENGQFEVFICNIIWCYYCSNTENVIQCVFITFIWITIQYREREQNIFTAFVLSIISLSLSLSEGIRPFSQSSQSQYPVIIFSIINTQSLNKYNHRKSPSLPPPVSKVIKSFEGITILS